MSQLFQVGDKVWLARPLHAPGARIEKINRATGGIVRSVADASGAVGVTWNTTGEASGTVRSRVDPNLLVREEDRHMVVLAARIAARPDGIYNFGPRITDFAFPHHLPEFQQRFREIYDSGLGFQFLDNQDICSMDLSPFRLVIIEQIHASGLTCRENHYEWRLRLLRGLLGRCMHATVIWTSRVHEVDTLIRDLTRIQGLPARIKVIESQVYYEPRMTHCELPVNGGVVCKTLVMRPSHSDEAWVETDAAIHIPSVVFEAMLKQMKVVHIAAGSLASIIEVVRFCKREARRFGIASF